MFLHFSAEVQLIIENRLKAVIVDDFTKLKELIIKGCIISAVPIKMANFLMEQRDGDLDELGKKAQSSLMQTKMCLQYAY